MKNKKRLVLIIVLLLLIALVGGISAYFTDVTDPATNTFTLGNVDIELTEPSWVAANGQNLAPNAKVAKDPTISVETGSNPAYVFAKVEVPYYNGAPLFTLLDENDAAGVNAGWVQVGTAATTTDKITYIYAYGTSTAMTRLTAGQSTAKPVFSKVQLAAISSSDAETLSAAGAPAIQINVTGYGIQADNLDSAVPATVWGYFGN